MKNKSIISIEERVALTPPDIVGSLSIKEVAPGSPAAELDLGEGAVLFSIDGFKVTSQAMSDPIHALSKTVVYQVYRRRTKTDLTITAK